MYEDVEIDDGPASKLQHQIARKWQHYLDLSAPHTGPRWVVTGLVIFIYCLRVYLINGIVLLAIVLDRITQAMGTEKRVKGIRHWYDTGPVGVIRKLINKNR